MLKKLLSLSFALILSLSLCACVPSTPTEVDTTTKFTSEGFTLSIPNEYVDLLIVDTTVSEGKDGTFFSVHEKASVEASKVLWSDDETMVGGFLFGIGRIDETAFHLSMMGGMTGMDVFARDEEGNYYIYYHPTDVQLIRVGDYTDADWEQWNNLCSWADIKPAFMSENPRLIPYERTYQDIDCALHYIAYADAPIRLTLKNGDVIYAPEFSDSMPYVEQLLDDVMYFAYSSGDELNPEGSCITLSVPDFLPNTTFDIFIDEGQQHIIRQNYFYFDGSSDSNYLVASRDGKYFPAGQIVADWLDSLN